MNNMRGVEMPQTSEARKNRYQTNSEYRRKEIERRKEARWKSQSWFEADRNFRVLGDTSTWKREVEIYRPVIEAGEGKRQLAVAFLEWQLEHTDMKHPDAEKRIEDLEFRKAVLERGPGADLIPVYRVGFVAKILGLSKGEFDYLEKKGVIPLAVSSRGAQRGREYLVSQIILLRQVFAEGLLGEADPDSETWKDGCLMKKPLMRNVFDLLFIAEALHTYWIDPGSFPFGGGEPREQGESLGRFSRVMFYRRLAEDRKQNPGLYNAYSL